MKTNVRIQETKGNYNHFYIEVLGPDSLGRLEHYYFISFQQTPGENEYYAMEINCKTDKPKKLIHAGKLLEYIKENSNWNAQPNEILQLIGAEKHYYSSQIGEFLPERNKDMPIYKAGYHYFQAPNEILAEKIRAKKYPTDKLTTV